MKTFDILNDFGVTSTTLDYNDVPLWDDNQKYRTYRRASVITEPNLPFIAATIAFNDNETNTNRRTTETTDMIHQILTISTNVTIQVDSTGGGGVNSMSGSFGLNSSSLIDKLEVASKFECIGWQKLILIIAFCLLIIVTIIGNTLVILSVITTRRLRTVTNCFVMSLAVADWLVGIFVMPPAVVYFVVGKLKHFFVHLFSKYRFILQNIIEYFNFCAFSK